MLEGDLGDLLDRRWKARLLEKDGNVRVAAFVCLSEISHGLTVAVGPGLPPAKLPGSLTSCSMTCVARPPGTWSARAYPSASAMAVTGHQTRSIFDRYNIVSEDDLRMAAQKTTMYVDTLPTTRVPG